MDVRELVTRLGYRVDTSGLRKGEKSIAGYVSKVRNIAMGAVAGLTALIGGLGFASIKASAEIESMTASFEVMLGDVDKAKRLMSDIVDMSDFTPFQAEDLARSAKMMLNMGIAAEDLMGNLKMLGDIAGNDKQRLQALTRAFGQMSSAGRLTGEDLNQMIDAGFNPLMVLAKRGGGGAAVIQKRYQSLRDEMSKGKVSVEAIKSAFQEVTSEGGLFFQNMEKQSRTMGGLWSTLIGLITRVRVIFGDYLKPVVVEVLSSINKWLTEKVIPNIKEWVASLDPLIWIYEDLLLVIKQLPELWNAVLKAFEPQIKAVKDLAAAFWDLVSNVFQVIGALFQTEGSLIGISTVIDGITLAIKSWVLLLKASAGGFKMILALLKGKGMDAVMKIQADIDADVKEYGEFLRDIFKPGEDGKQSTEERLQGLKDAFKNTFSNLSSTLKARRDTRIQNINVEVKQNNTIKAPAAKDGTTGLSADGLDAAMRKVQKSLFAAQLNKLIVSSMGG